MPFRPKIDFYDALEGYSVNGVRKSNEGFRFQIEAVAKDFNKETLCLAFQHMD